MKKQFEAVLHLRSKDPQSVYQLGGKVYTNMNTNQSTFTNPDPTMPELSTQLGKLDSALKAKDGTDLKNQVIKDQTDIVYALLKNQAAYVTKISKGDKAIILLSGFDCDVEPEFHAIPGKVVIKRVEDGSGICSVKIYIEPLVDADRYKVEITTTPADPSSWKSVLDPASLFKLEISGLARGQEIFIRVTGGNRHGWGIPSECVAFIPR